MNDFLDRPKVIFCDIDGTILKNDSYLLDDTYDPEVNYKLPGVYEKFGQWLKKGFTIILTTCRKESMRSEQFNSYNYTVLHMTY